MSEASDNGSIRFTVKELLAEVNGKLDRISDKLDSKAEAHDLDALEARVTAIEKESAEVRIVADALKNDKSERFTVKQKIVGTLVTLTVTGLSVASFVRDLLV
jgi:hypothetical protein